MLYFRPLLLVETSLISSPAPVFCRCTCRLRISRLVSNRSIVYGSRVVKDVAVKFPLQYDVAPLIDNMDQPPIFSSMETFAAVG